MHVNKPQQLEGNIGRCSGGGKHSSGSIHWTDFCGLGFRFLYPTLGLKCAVDNCQLLIYTASVT